MNSPRAQLLIQSVENILYNYQNGGASPERVAEALMGAYTRVYGEVPMGTNKEK